MVFSSHLCSYTWVQICWRCCARLTIIVVQQFILETILADEVIIIKAMIIIPIILRHYWKTCLDHSHMKLICRDRVLSVQSTTQISKLVPWRGILWMNVWVVEVLVRVQDTRVRLVPEFRDLWHMQNILTTVAAGLTNTVIIFHFVVIYVIRSGVG